MSAVYSDWQTEKLPLDVLGKVYEALFWSDASKWCPFCHAPYACEVRSPSVVNAILTCRRWKQGWTRLVHSVMRGSVAPCYTPFECVSRFVRTRRNVPFKKIT
jgi:hypothetical protein